MALTKNMKRTGRAGATVLAEFRESLTPPEPLTKLEELEITLKVKVGFSGHVDWYINYLKEKGTLTPEIEAKELASKKANNLEIRKLKAKIRRLKRRMQ